MSFWTSLRGNANELPVSVPLCPALGTAGSDGTDCAGGRIEN